MKNKIAAQLWSVRDAIDVDFVGTLKAIAEMGYTGVEFAGVGGISAKEMKQHLRDFNLDGVSAHIGLDNLQNNLEAEMEYLLTIGARFIVCPSAGIRTVDDAKNLAAIFNGIGEKCFNNGLTLAYHNHDFEFKMDKGHYPLEVFYEHVNPRYVKQQPDVYWVAYAGLDVNDYMVKNAARCPIIHLKQLENMETKANVNAGAGILDFKFIADAAPDAVLVYEQEHYIATSMEEMKTSLEFIRGL